MTVIKEAIICNRLLKCVIVQNGGVFAANFGAGFLAFGGGLVFHGCFWAAPAASARQNTARIDNAHRLGARFLTAGVGRRPLSLSRLLP